MSRNFAVPYWILAFVFCVIAVILCVAYVDRPVADFAEEIYRAHYKLVSVEHFLRPLAVVVVLAPLFLAGAAYWKLTRTRLSSWTEVPLLCSWSVVWALSAAIVLKHIFGRTQVYPTYIRDHIYGFRLLHGTSGYDAFPSGTTTVAAAILAVLWITVPRVRIVWALALALVAASLVITNAHFVADVIGGGFLGALIGWMTVVLLRSNAESPLSAEAEREAWNVKLETSARFH